MSSGDDARWAELFETVEGATLRRMFGGIGIFKNGLMFALVSDDALYLKADETTAPRFEAEGFGQWIYSGRDRSVPMPYWRVPDRLLDEPDEFREWALIAFDVAEKTKKPPREKKPAKKIAKPTRRAAARKAPAKKKPAAKRR